MQNYKIYFDNGEVIEMLGVEFDADTFTQTLNDQRVVFVNLGGLITHKHSIRRMVPFEAVERTADENAAS